MKSSRLPYFVRVATITMLFQSAVFAVEHPKSDSIELNKNSDSWNAGHYHPEMKGKTSIKKVLPAVWNNNPWLHNDPWFADYKPSEGSSLNPYDRLVDMTIGLEASEVVEDRRQLSRGGALLANSQRLLVELLGLVQIAPLLV